MDTEWPSPVTASGVALTEMSPEGWAPGMLTAGDLHGSQEAFGVGQVWGPLGSAETSSSLSCKASQTAVAASRRTMRV